MNANLKVFAIIVMKNTFKGTNARRIIFFMAISEKILKDDGDVLPPKLFLQVEDINMPFDQLEVEPLISGFSH